MTYQKPSRPVDGLTSGRARYWREHGALPADVRDALVKYDQRVSDGTIKPWDPDKPMATEYDSWLTGWLATQLPLWFLDPT